MQRADVGRQVLGALRQRVAVEGRDTACKVEILTGRIERPLDPDQLTAGPELDRLVHIMVRELHHAEDGVYFSDDGDLQAVRYDNWKIVFAQQRAMGTMLTWSEPLVNTRMPWLYNLRTDPYEKATITSNTYWDWWLDHAYLLVPAQGYVGKFLGTFEEFPPRQKAASFTIDDVMEQLNPATH